MKLNNHGWGYRDMIIWTTVMILLLFFVAVQIDNFYEGFENSTDNKNNTEVVNEPSKNNDIEEDDEDENDSNIIIGSDIESNATIPVDYDYYHDREKELKQASLAYLRDYNYDLSSEILTIALDTLINFGYMREIYDQTGRSLCTGYSNAYENSSTGEYVVTPSITCNNYTTK